MFLASKMHFECVITKNTNNSTHLQSKVIFRDMKMHAQCELVKMCVFNHSGSPKPQKSYKIWFYKRRGGDLKKNRGERGESMSECWLSSFLLACFVGKIIYDYIAKNRLIFSGQYFGQLLNGRVWRFFCCKLTFGHH